eukprot:4566246-Lingulodinium_polyedra.AAC.1
MDGRLRTTGIRVEGAPAVGRQVPGRGRFRHPLGVGLPPWPHSGPRVGPRCPGSTHAAAPGRGGAFLASGPAGAGLIPAAGG